MMMMIMMMMMMLLLLLLLLMMMMMIMMMMIDLITNNIVIAIRCTHPFNETKLVMTRKTGRSLEAPSNKASSTCTDELCKRPFSLDTKALSFIKVKAESGSFSGSVVSTNPCHSSSLSAS